MSLPMLPTALTLLRIILIPIILACLMLGGTQLLIIAFGLFVLAAITDFLDGYLARKMGVVTTLGRFLDPIADKLLIACLLPVFCLLGLLPGWWVVAPVIILFREILVSGLREFLGPYNVVIHVTQLAKWKTTLQLVACALLIIAPVLGGVWLLVAQSSMAVAALITAITGYEYMIQGFKHMRDMEKRNDQNGL